MTLSILGIYNQDETVLNATNFPLPQTVDRDVLVPMILSETAEFEVIYPDPATLKIVIKAWATARAPAWQRMIDALDEEYNPLHNYDRHEEETIDDAEAIDDTTQTTLSDTTTGQVTGFNSPTFTDDRKTIGSGSRSGTSGRDRTYGRDRDLHVYGNIGVVTAADMLAGEIKIRATDIYRIICDEFTRYFCIMVY